MKALFIDMDGTLIDSIPVLYKVYLEFLESFGISGSKEDFKSILGPSIREVIPLLKARYQLKPECDELLKKYHFLLDEIYEREVQLFPYAMEFLEFIRGFSLKVILVTSATSSSTYAIIERLKIKKSFDEIVTSDGLKRSKPDPEIYKKALELAQVSPVEAIAIEDSPAGIKAVLGAEIVPIWIRNKEREFLKYHEDPRLIEASDWKVIQSLFRHWKSGKEIAPLWSNWSGC